MLLTSDKYKGLLFITPALTSKISDVDINSILCLHCNCQLKTFNRFAGKIITLILNYLLTYFWPGPANSEGVFALLNWLQQTSAWYNCSPVIFRGHENLRAWLISSENVFCLSSIYRGQAAATILSSERKACSSNKLGIWCHLLMSDITQFYYATVQPH